MQKLANVAFSLFLLMGAGAIVFGSVAYFGEDLGEAPFVIEKLPLPWESVWLAALRVHVVSALFSLPVCVVLHVSALRCRAPRLHRWLGRVTGIVIVGALVPSGLYLAVFAKGGALGGAGFALSGIITAVALVQSVRAARARRFRAHQRWSRHVSAQLSVAVTSRALLILFEAAALQAEVSYVIALWLPVVASAAVVEWLTPQRRFHARPRLASFILLPWFSARR